MPVHDWTRVEAGVFHDFHNVWIAELRNAMNSGLLPHGYYAMSEQHGNKYIGDVLTLERPARQEAPPRATAGGLELAEAPPIVRRKESLSPTAAALRKTLTIRHATGHRIVALVEIVSRANKVREEYVEKFLNTIEDALAQGIHVLLVDLFPPGRHDSRGLHVALWDRLGDVAENPPEDEPLTLASYCADTPLEAYLEYVAVGNNLPDMPLFFDLDRYVNTPLQATYDASWRGTPEVWREVLEKPNGKARRKRGR
ncbi:MAG: DUF4058 domain-containing protein [Planctomycetes bacterium]|nr:DUF4058 domain-containing protein [Planctomycetota bacterium]